MEKKAIHRKRVHLNNFDYKSSSYVYFITLCTASKQPHFLNNRIAKIVEEEMELRRARKEIRVFCYCIMPDYLHMLLSLADNYQKSLQNWVSAFKRFTGKVINELCNTKPLWQKNFYDHIVREDESLLEIAKYILNNPVRKGLVPEWAAYPYSKTIDPLPLWEMVRSETEPYRHCHKRLSFCDL